MTAEEDRGLALGLPDAVEQDHHGPVFRVAGRIFVTIEDERTINVMVDEPGHRTAAAEQPAWCSERYLGRRLAAAVDLSVAPEAGLRQLLPDA